MSAVELHYQIDSRVWCWIGDEGWNIGSIVTIEGESPDMSAKVQMMRTWPDRKTVTIHTACLEPYPETPIPQP